jgi:hypothetical protein
MEHPHEVPAAVLVDDLADDFLAASAGGSRHTMET